MVWFIDDVDDDDGDEDDGDDGDDDDDDDGYSVLLPGRAFLNLTMNTVNCPHKNTNSHVTYLSGTSPSYCPSHCIFHHFPFLLKVSTQVVPSAWVHYDGEILNQDTQKNYRFNGKSEGTVTNLNCSWNKPCFLSRGNHWNWSNFSRWNACTTERKVLFGDAIDNCWNHVLGLRVAPLIIKHPNGNLVVVQRESSSLETGFHWIAFCLEENILNFWQIIWKILTHGIHYTTYHPNHLLFCNVSLRVAWTS